MRSADAIEAAAVILHAQQNLAAFHSQIGFYRGAAGVTHGIVKAFFENE
jgi:hypothetical protein